jgi:hypothetical protein
LPCPYWVSAEVIDLLLSQHSVALIMGPTTEQLQFAQERIPLLMNEQ